MDLSVDRKLVYYGGNYDTYVRTKEELETNQIKAYYKQQDEIAHIKKFIASAGTYVLPSKNVINFRQTWFVKRNRSRRLLIKWKQKD